MRWLRALRILLAIAAVGVAVVFAASFVRGLRIDHDGDTLCLSRGVIVLLRYADTSTWWKTPPDSWQFSDPASVQEVMSAFADFGWADLEQGFLHSRIMPWARPVLGRAARLGLPNDDIFLTIIPLWFPFLIFSAAWFTLWKFGPSRHPTGHCRKCGYDLRAFPGPSPCPECGTSRKSLSHPAPPNLPAPPPPTPAG